MASDPDTDATTATVLQHRFHRECGLTLAERFDGGARCDFEVNAFTANPFGMLHGGILYAMLDVAAFLAVVPTLADNEAAVSHDVHVSVLRAAARDETITLNATILRRGQRLVFCRVDAHADDGRLVACASVTKSIVAAG